MDEETRANLIAAGCDDEFISEFERCAGDGRKCEKLLAKHRRELLERVHADERRISNLDYLIYSMEKQRSNVT